MKERMKRIVALGLAVSMFCNGGGLISNAEENSLNTMKCSAILNEAENLKNFTEQECEINTQGEAQTNLLVEEGNGDFVVSTEEIEIQVGQKAYFYITQMSEAINEYPTVNLLDDKLVQITEMNLDNCSEIENGKELQENVPANAKWYEIVANVAGNTLVRVEQGGIQKEIQIVIREPIEDEPIDGEVTEESETAASQAISNGWSQDGWYYYINGEPVKGITEIKGVLYYFDVQTGRLCKKAQWIEQAGKRYYSNASGILYRNQLISFGNTYYYMGSDGSVQSGIIRANNGRMYYAGKDGVIQKKKQWIEEGGKRYYSNADGILYQNQVITFGSVGHCMGEDGSVQYGIAKAGGTYYHTDKETGEIVRKAQWIESNGKRYYSNGNGKLYQNQVITFGNIGYCMGEDASVQYGIAKAGGKYYHTDEKTGIIVRKAGWIEANGKRYYAKADGNLYQNQFISFGYTYYYCGSDAAIVKNTTQAVNGVLYRFDGNGVMIKEGGWGEYRGNKYYKNPATGFPYKNQWVTFGRTWYYANANGFMVSGWQTIGGYRYYFYSDTKYMARNTVIDGIRIGDDGRVVSYADRMASFSTISTNNANGTYNMSRALNSFNQVIINPGQTISFFGIAGPCGKEEGYLPAGVVGGVGYGGGICQASTTLYGAALRSGLTIVERRNHSVPSTYVPIGQDAMVSYGSSDLKIRNDFDFPVKLVTYTRGKTLYAEVWGTQPSWYDYIKIESWRTGRRSAVAYRKYIKNGQVVRTEQLPSSYY